MLLLRLESRTFEVTGSVKIYMIFQLVPGFRFHSFEIRSFNICTTLDYSFVFVFMRWSPGELYFWHDINFETTKYRERFYMVLEHGNSVLNIQELLWFNRVHLISHGFLRSTYAFLVTELDFGKNMYKDKSSVKYQFCKEIKQVTKHKDKSKANSILC